MLQPCRRNLGRLLPTCARRAPERVRLHPPHFPISLGGRADQEGDDAPAGSLEITGAAAAGQLEGAESAALATGPVAAASS